MMGTLAQLLKSLDADKGKKGKQFEHICKWFLLNDPVYRRQLRRVWLWNEWPGWWGRDAGIDLVAEDHQSRLWAIQAKAYDPRHWVKKSEVDSFLSESGRGRSSYRFAYRLLIATTDRIGATARQTIDDQEKPVGVVGLADLEASGLNWPTSVADLRPRSVQAKAPLPHQRQAVNAVVRGFKVCDRGQMIMACGTGKTLTALWIAERLKAPRTLVLAPSLSLLSQTLRAWLTNTTAGFASLVVCSDDTVSDHDAVVSTTTELGMPTTTKSSEIAKFLRGRGRRVIFATYQSSPQIAKAYRVGGVPYLDLIVADEAHRCAGVSGAFATVLKATAIRARRRLFMTATPRYFTGRVIHAAREADFEMASMDDESKFGPEFHRLSFGEAIARDLLTNYQVAVIGVDDATYKDWAERGHYLQSDRLPKTDARTLAAQIGLAKAIRRYKLRRSITFHSRVATAQDFAKELPEVIAEMIPSAERPKTSVWAELVSGKMNAGQRNVRLRRLRYLDRGAAGVLTNSRCLSEGVDVPTLDGVAFIDPKRSEVDIIQAVGRAIRKAEDKKVGTIVIPVFIAAEDEPEAILDSSAFKPVWDVLKALRAHDSDLAERLDALRRDIGRGVSPTRDPTIDFVLPDRVPPGFVAAFNVRLVEATTSSWEFWYGLLERYFEQTGKASPPVDEEFDGHKLGSWTNSQRGHYREGSYPPERAARLEAFPGWTWEPQDAAWLEGYRALKAYLHREGNTNVPQGHKESGYPLGHWVAVQRVAHSRDRLENERDEKLAALPGWVWNPRQSAWDATWKHNLSLLKTYAKREGHARVPQNHVEGGTPLGRWVAKQRAAQRRHDLSPERTSQLSAVKGWAWEVDNAVWEECFALLEKYVTEHRNARVPQNYIHNKRKLGSWVVNQRTRRDLLTEEQRARLEVLPGWAWNTKEADWETNYQALKSYASKHAGALPSPGQKVDGLPVGSWLKVQRTAHRSMSKNRIRKLESIEGWTWSPLDDQWDQAFESLTCFVKREHNALVPNAHMEPPGFALGKWVERQRTAHRNHTLARLREIRLEKLPEWTWEPRDARWQHGYELLIQWSRERDTSSVPARHLYEGFPLGDWVATQRALYRRSQLRQDRIAQLEQLKDWRWSL
jgi:superfamily II DNA or RNA helicase